MVVVEKLEQEEGLEMYEERKESGVEGRRGSRERRRVDDERGDDGGGILVGVDRYGRRSR